LHKKTLNRYRKRVYYKKEDVYLGMLSKEDHSVVFSTHTTIPIFTLIHFRSVNPTMRVQPLIVYLTPEQKGYSVTRWVWSFDRLTMSLKVSCLARVMSTTSSLSRYLHISLANLSKNSRTCLLSVWINPLSQRFILPYTQDIDDQS